MVKRSEEKEILDEVTPGQEELSRVMKRLVWQNWIGGNDWLIYFFVKRLVKGRRNFSVLDVGTGIADLPLYLVKKFERDGVKVEVTGVDTNAAVLDLAKQEMRLPKEIRLMHGRAEDALGQFDMVIASQMLHHLGPQEVISFLRTVYGKAKIGIVISDFSRSLFGYRLIKLFMYLTFADRIHRHDGPLSILRAYTGREVREMLYMADVRNFTIHNFLFRKIIVIRKVEE